MTLTASGTYGSESAWSDSTGGFSVYESEPSYQTLTLESVGLSDGVRTTPDVAFDADPDSGVSVYDSAGYDGQSGWFQVGGTSLAAPAWAGLIAIVDQGLATAGKSSLTTTEVLTDLYSLPSSDFNDVTTGSNGYSATAGYDLVTGLGTPRANLLVADVLAENDVSESTATTTSTTTAASKSPHKAKSKHTKVVVKKRHKATRKTELASSLTSGTTGDTDAPARSRLGDSSTTASASVLKPSRFRIRRSALSPQSRQVAVRTPVVQQMQSSSAGADANNQLNRSLASDQIPSTDSVRVNDAEPGESSDCDRETQAVSNLEENDPMTRLAVVSYEPVLLHRGLYPPSRQSHSLLTTTTRRSRPWPRRSSDDRSSRLTLARSHRSRPAPRARRPRWRR